MDGVPLCAHQARLSEQSIHLADIAAPICQVGAQSQISVTLALVAQALPLTRPPLLEFPAICGVSCPIHHFCVGTDKQGPINDRHRPRGLCRAEYPAMQRVQFAESFIDVTRRACDVITGHREVPAHIVHLNPIPPSPAFWEDPFHDDVDTRP
jgi:hypothetical protein